VDLPTVIGSVAAFCTTASYAPQLKKCWDTGSAGDLSLRMLLVLAGGVALWTGYGILKGDVVIVLANAVSLCLLLAILSFKLREARRATTALPAHDEALRHSEERYRQVVENARDYAIFTIDADGRIVDWYEGAIAVFGWSAEEIRGQPADVLFLPEDRARGEPARELATAVERGVAPDVRWHLRKDGTRVFIEGRVVPIASHSHTRAFLKMGRDVTQARRAAQALRRMEERFSRFAEASSDVVWIRDADILQFEYASPSFETIYGVDRQSVFAGNSLRRWLRLIHPDDRASALGGIRAVREGRRLTHEFRIRRPDGTMRWIRDTDFPLVDDAGRITGVGGIGTDITEEKRAADRQQLLIREVQHRTRNLMGVIRSLCDTTARETGSIDAFVSSFGKRLSALSRVQGMLSRLGEGDRVAFDALLTAELAAHGMLGDTGRVTLSGPGDVPLKSRNVQTFALALHELATNAVKHGAFATPGGHLAVQWRLETTQGTRKLHVDWRETGMTSLDRQASSGFGRELIERALPYQMDAETLYEIGEQGVHCVIVLSLSDD
jgi:two-component system CheB/CheR fusion protein